jgi:hypothetical protein
MPDDDEIVVSEAMIEAGVGRRFGQRSTIDSLIAHRASFGLPVSTARWNESAARRLPQRLSGGASNLRKGYRRCRLTEHS